MKRHGMAILMSLGVAWLHATAKAEMNTNPTPESAVIAQETVSFGMGCFWCGEAVFQRVDGVLSVTSGYQGGETPNPTYKQVCSGRTGHAEVIRVSYDPKRVTFAELLAVFWKAHDPTQLNRQGADVGTQYRSAIYTETEAQRLEAEASKAALDASGLLRKPVVTEIAAAKPFYPAEADHQDYYNNNRAAPYCRMVIAPKLQKLGMAE